jgi:hypothetical protein
MNVDRDYRIIRPLLRQAGLELLRISRQSLLSLSGLYGLEDCYDIYVDPYRSTPDLECEKYSGRPIHTVLSLHIDDISLCLRSMVRDDGMFYWRPGSFTCSWAEDNTEQGMTDWTWVRAMLGSFLHKQNATYDLLLLSGPSTIAEGFQQIIREQFKDNAKIVPTDYLRSPEDHIMAASRVSARRARMLLCDPSGCVLSYWCPVSECCERLAPRFELKTEKKAEL